MKYILSLLFLVGTMAPTFAQNNQYTTSGDSDPEAKAILDKIKKKYDGYESIEAEFALEMQFPEEPLIVQEGVVAKSGKKYYMNTGDYTAICNGEAIWFVIKANKEVQVNNMPEEGEEESLLSPEAMFTFYEKGNYVYILANQFMENKIPVQQIEFKPLDDDSEYSKLRLTLNKNTNEVIRVKTFSKDGTTYTLKVNGITPNKKFDSQLFTFDASKFPNFHVEDLR